MRKNRLKEILGNGGTVYGTFVSTPEIAVVEMIGWAGYDFVIIDMEHSPINFGHLPSLFSAANNVDLVPLVRVGTSAANPILRVLDSGAMGVMVPHVRNREEAMAIVRASRYPPQGARGVSGASRAAHYGHKNFIEHAQESNSEILTIALIEDKAGVDAIDEIIDVSGLDVICPGAGDLSAGLGLLGQPQHPSVQADVAKVVEAVTKHSKQVLGCHAMGAEQRIRCQAQGARFVIYSQDTRVILDAYRNALVDLKNPN